MKETEADHNRSSETKGDFRKVTITLPPDIYERLIQESARRKIAGAPNHMLSALFREALSLYLERLE